MTYRLRVFTEDQWHGRDDSSKSLWMQYVYYCKNVAPNDDTAYIRLSEFNAVDVKNKPFLEFESEEDAMAFRLRFG